MSRQGEPGRFFEDEQSVRRLVRKLLRQGDWVRREGLGRWIEEDQLNPVDRARIAFSKWHWRHRHGGQPGEAIPVFLVGVQRSGTNMLVRGLEAAPQFEVHNENDKSAFLRYRLRSDPAINDLIAHSRHRYVLFKPLCDSHRTDELLDTMRAARPGRAIWAYRHVDGRVRSAINKFGDVNLRVLADIGRGEGGHRWQAQRLSAASLDLIRSFDYTNMTPETAAALFWYVRNCLFFEIGLDQREDAFLSSYDQLVAEPQRTMKALCAFLGFPFSAALVEHIEDRQGTSRPLLPIDPRVRELCDALTDRLDGQARHQVERWTAA